MLADRVCRDLGPELLAGGAEVRYVRYGYSEGETLLGAMTGAAWQLRKPATKEEAFRPAPAKRSSKVAARKQTPTKNGRDAVSP